MKLSLSLFIFFLCFLSATVHSQNTTKVADALRQISADPELSNALVGFCLMELNNNSPLLALNEHLSMTPASVIKLLTTAASLHYLGGGFRYETRLEYDGSIAEGGILNGNLFITGGGDPTLGAQNYQNVIANWTEAIKKAGIRKVNGYLIADASFMEDHNTPNSWAWGDIGNYYGSGVSGLAFHENFYYLYFRQGAKKGDPTQILRTIPEVSGLEFINEVQSGAPGSGDNAYIYGAPYTYQRYLRGTIPAGSGEFSVKGALPEPALLAATLLESSLKKQGISIHTGAVTLRQLHIKGLSIPTRTKTLLHATYSPALRDMVKTVNVKSHNLYAEHLFRTTGWRQYGKASIDNAIKAMEDFLTRNAIESRGLFIEDGSGLSRSTAITAWQLCQLLQKASTLPFYQDFLKSLPVAGQSGTVASFGKGTAAEGKAMIKSGSMNRVRAYAGYVKSEKGNTYIFAVMVNNFGTETRTITKNLETLVASIALLP